MAQILHGTWLPAQQKFFVWGETLSPTRRKGRQPTPPPHPFQCSPDLLKEILSHATASALSAWREQTLTVWLPSVEQTPFPSPDLVDQGAVTPTEGTTTLGAWQVTGLLAPATVALDVLLALSSAKGLGADIQTWRVAAQLALEMVAGQQVMPALAREGFSLRAVWRPRPTPATAHKLATLAQSVPPLCRAVVDDPANAPPPRTLINLFLTTTLDAVIREMAVEPKLLPSTLGGKWLAALLGANPIVNVKGRDADGLYKSWQAWSGQAQVAGDTVFRVTFRLEPPPQDPEPWSLSYLLQATDDPSLLVPAASIWRETGDEFVYLERRFSNPQERLLTALGYAARLFPPLIASLRTATPDHATLSTAEAFTFLKEAAPLLENSGFGVLVPGWWKKGGRLQARARVKSKSPVDNSGRLSFQTLVNYEWEVSLGDEKISPEEFARLANLKMPLVQVRGQWVVLDPEHMRAAFKYFEKRQGQMTLGEALHQGLVGEGEDAPEGVEVSGMAVGGWLQELLDRLRDAQKLDVLPPPDTLHGQLRPYQARGYSWLVFMRQFGLGACLADDMGLGKCLAPDSLILVDGTPRRADELWESYAGEIEFDGEGLWASPTEPLQVNSLDEETGRLVEAPIRRLYRQAVREPLRKVYLEDGSSITTTRRHQLLTEHGWDHELKVGDYVCMPRGFEVSYCRVKVVEDIDYEGWVYDFEVERHHNFVANNILCHNTIQTIALLLHERESQLVTGPALLVCPTSVVGNWVRELERFAPSLKVMVHRGAGRLQNEAFVETAQQHDIVLTSFPLLARDRETLTTLPWSTAVLDEAQNIKNSSTKQAQAARALQAQTRLALTGTPVENRLSELWSIMAYLNPGYLGSEETFRQRFARPIERMQDAQATERLRRLTAPFILRRLKTDRAIITDLPDKLEMKTYCPLVKEQATLYEAVVQDALRQVEEAGSPMERRGLVLAMLTKLKQICNHPRQFLKDGSEIAGRSGKLARLTEMLEEVYAAGDRALIFTQFAEMGHLLQEHLGKVFYDDVLFLHGGTPAKERDEMVRRFQAPHGPTVFILSLKAGGTGLNLTRANHVFHYDRWWNPAVENQATDRAFRIGQTQRVQVHKYICGGTLEDHIDQLIESKRALAESILGAGETWLTELNTDQLRDLVMLRRAEIVDEEGK